MTKFVRRSVYFMMLLAGVIMLTPVAKAADQYGYNNGFFLSSADGEFMVKMNEHLTSRYMFQMLDGAGVENTSGFTVPFARTYFSGNAFGPDWSYLVSFDLSTGAVQAFDYYVNWHHCDMLNIKVGQFKVPYGFEFMTPDYYQQFAVGSTVTNAGGFVPGREIGVALWGSAAEKKLDWALAITNGLPNGTGRNSGQGAADVDMRYTARFTYHGMGHHDYWMSDLGKSEEGQMAVSLGGYWNKLQLAPGDFGNTFGLNADVVYAMSGFSALVEYHMFMAQPAAGDVTNHGVNGQFGYLFDEANEVAVRVSWLEPDAGGRTITPGVVWNHYIHGQNAKLQIEYDMNLRQDVPVTATTSDDLTDHMATAQLQFFL